MKWTLTIAMIFSVVMAMASDGIKLRVVTGEKKAPLVTVFIDHTDQSVVSDQNGIIYIEGLSEGEHTLTVFAEGYQTQVVEVSADAQGIIEIEMVPLQQDLQGVDVLATNQSGTGVSYMRYIEVDGLYAAKKNEIIVPEEMTINRANNNGRQVFSKVPGINVQETDAGGLQLGVGARGLDPKRTTNFNTRQDGYDIAADALGYPESYYTPPIEAVEKIELVRGAASLQYGTQFGGLLNFKMKRGNEDKPVEIISRQTAGSYGFFGSFNSIGGSAGDWNYYAFYQHKEGSGWRPNSFFNANMAYAQVGRQIGQKWSVDLAVTHSHYVAKQPGGLTDRMFETDPSQSHRSRNWFRVDWNIAALTLNGKLTKNLSINSKTFGLMAERAALGFLGNINRVDTMGERDLILGNYLNIGNETRLIQRFNLRSNPGAVLAGVRLYQGNTHARQGKAEGFAGPDFEFINPDALEGSDYRFPSQNVSVFSEALIPINGCWYVTPGVRFEYIKTENSGYYLSESRHPLTNELLASEQVWSSSQTPRNLVLMGIGTSYRCFEGAEIYANVSQNYRAINFSDIRVVNANIVVDSNLQDEHGYTADLGFRGKLFKNAMMIDASGFLMMYNNRIGQVHRAMGDNTTKLVRTNIADARFLGIEVFEEINIPGLFRTDLNWKLSWYNNLSIVEARYLASSGNTFAGNRVENVPLFNYRTGLAFKNRAFGASVQYSYVSQQFTDASNAEFYPDATIGLIPAYQVVDVSVNYTWKRFTVEGSVNNLLDEIYFTRRATGYPGPGIIPAERRMVFTTLQVRI